MSDYKETVRISLSRLDSEELLEKIRKNYLTDEAKEVAEKILSERGVDSKSGFPRDENTTEANDFVVTEDVAFVGYPKVMILIWMATAFLFGISQSIRLPGAAPDSPGVVMLRLTQGIFYFFVVGIIVGIYAYVKREKITTKAEVTKKYGSNIKSIIVINMIVLVILLVKLFFGYSNILAFIDVAIVGSLTIAIFKRVKTAKFVLAAYAFINPLIFAFTGYGGPAGIIWSFVFLTCCQAITTENRYSNASNNA